MASQLRVDEIIASTGSSVAIGTAGGSVTLAGDFTVDTSKGLNVGTGASIFSPSSNTLTLGTNNAERVRIDSSGNVGIGTNTSLVDILTINDTNPKISIRDAGTERAFIEVDSSDNLVINNKSISNLIFETSDSEKLRITSDGKIGFNYAGTPPSEDIMICTSGQASPAGISLSHLSGGNRYGARLQSISGANEGIVISSLFNSTYTERLRINSSGNVGIGTDIIEGKLTIFATAAEPPTSGTTANSAIQLYSSLSNQMNLGLNTVNGDYGAYIQVSDNNHAVNYPLNLQPNGGNIGAGGITTPTFTTGGGIHLGDAYGIGFGNGANGRPDFQIVYDTGQNFGLQIRCGNGADTADVYFTTAGNLAFASGKGIDFSANGNAAGMTSELLDDYEEGTWTPGLQLSSQSGSFNFTGNNGARYTKIGRVVHVNGIIEWQSHNLTAGVNLQVTGLPFTSASSNKDRSGISISYTSSPWTGISVYQQALRSETSATYMTFNYSNSTSGDMSHTFSWNHLDTTGTFIFFGMYIV